MKDKEAEELALAKIIDPWVFDIPEHLISGRMEMERRQYNAREAASLTLAHGYVLAAEERERVIEECAKVADDEAKRCAGEVAQADQPELCYPWTEMHESAVDIAKLIRALSSQSTKGETE